MKLSAATVVDNYAVLFPPLVRAAHRACLEHARLTRDDKWPTIQSCIDFAGLYGIPAAEIAAFFGYLGHNTGGRTVWVDALRGGASSYLAQKLATPAQARAFGFQCFVSDVARETAH